MVEISERLLTQIEATTIQMRRELAKGEKRTLAFQKKTTGMVQRVDKSFDSLGDSIKRNLEPRRIGLFATAVGTGLAFATKKALDFADTIAKTADRIGVTTDQLQELRFAASQTGVAQAQLDIALQRFIRRTGEAANGTGELVKVLEQYDIEVKEANGDTRDSIDILKDLADATQGASSGAEQLRIAFKAFDSEGAALVNLLRQGSEGLERFQQQARDLGLVMDENIIRQAEAANDELDILAKSIRTQLASSLASISPAIIQIGKSIREVIPDIVDFWERWALPDNMQSVAMLNERMAELLKNIRAIESQGGDVSGLQAEFERLRELRGEAIRTRDALEALREARRGEGGAAPEEADDTAEKALERIRQEVEALNTTARQQAVLNNVRALGVEVTSQQVDAEGRLVAELGMEAQEMADLTNQITDRQEAQEQLNEALDREEDLKSRLASVESSLRTENERIAETLKVINEARREGLITLERSIELQEKLSKQQKETTDDMKVQKQAARDVMNATNEALQGNLKTWQDYGAAVLKILQNIIIAQLEANRASGTGQPGSLGGGIIPFFGRLGGSIPTTHSGGSIRKTGMHNLQQGEEVIQSKIANQPGVRPMLRAINNGIFPQGGNSASISIGTIDARGAAPGTAQQIEAAIARQVDRLSRDSFGTTRGQRSRKMTAQISRTAATDFV